MHWKLCYRCLSCFCKNFEHIYIYIYIYIYIFKIHAGHCWRSKDELISDVLQWNPAYERASVGRPTTTYLHQVCKDSGCSLENLPGVMNHKNVWRLRVWEILAVSSNDHFERKMHSNIYRNVVTDSLTCVESFIIIHILLAIFLLSHSKF